MAKLIGTDPNQVPTNADLGTTAYTNVQAMPKVVIGEPQEGIRFVDAFDNYALRLNGNDYYSSAAKLSRTGSGTYTGSLQFEKIKTDADGNAVDAKSGDRVMQIYSSVTTDTGEYCDGPSIIATLLADVGSDTSATGRLQFLPNGGSSVIASIDSDGLKFNGDTHADNALDDFESGTFDVTLTDGTNSGTRQFAYVKTGDAVQIHGPLGNSSFFILSSSGSGTGTNLSFTGSLPYVPQDGGGIISSAFRGIRTSNAQNMDGNGIMPVLGWRAGSAAMYLDHTRDENSYEFANSTERDSTRTNIVLNFNGWYRTAS